MSLYKRKDSKIWWCEFKDGTGKRVQKSTGTEIKALAQEYYDRVKVEVWEQRRIGVKARHMWNEAVLRYLAEKSEKVTLETDKSHLRWLDPHLNGKYLDEINRDLISRITLERQKPYEILRKKGPPRKIEPKANTVNRTLEIIRAILRMARDEWEWIATTPKIAMKKVNSIRVSWITREQAEELLKHLPEHQQAMMRFALETGLRRSNVTHLQWGQIDLEKRLAWIHPDQAKARKAIGVPLSREAVLILSLQWGKHPTWVFPYQGKPVIQTSTKTWRDAVKKPEFLQGLRGIASGTRLPHGMHRMAHHCMCCKSWEAGLHRRWCGGMRICLRSILRIMWTVAWGCKWQVLTFSLRYRFWQ